MSLDATTRMRTFLSLLPAKGRAAGIHVAISLVIFLVLLYLILVKWYPMPYFQVDGGWQGIRLMFAIDVVLGPLLTFIIFDTRKSRRAITFDLTLIALVQFSALAWGAHTVHSQRPVAIVEYDGVLEAAIAEDFKTQAVSLDSLAQYDDRHPPVIFERVDPDDYLTILRLSGQGIPRRAQTSLYERFKDRLPELFTHAATYESKITKVHPELVPALQAMRVEHGQGVGFLPFSGRHGTLILVFSPDGNVVDSLPQP